MKSNINPLLGAGSVLLFFVLLGFTVFGAVQGQEEPAEEPRPPGPHPLEGFGPEDISQTPAHNAELQERNLLERVEVDCSAGTPRLVLVANEPLPAGTETQVSAHGPLIADQSGLMRAALVGEPERTSVLQEATSIPVDLSSGLLEAEFDHLLVVIRFTDRDGIIVQSNIEQVPGAAARCESGG